MSVAQYAPTTSPLAILANLVRNKRISLLQTQAGFAAKHGLSRNTITAIEQHRRRYLSGTEIDQIAKALGMEPDTLWQMIGLPRQKLGRARYVGLVP